MAVLPFDWGALTKILLRPTMSSLKVRPSIVRPQNVKDKNKRDYTPVYFLAKYCFFNKNQTFLCTLRVDIVYGREEDMIKLFVSDLDDTLVYNVNHMQKKMNVQFVG